MGSYYRDRDSYSSRDYSYRDSYRDYETESISGASTRDPHKVVVKRYKVPDRERNEEVDVRVSRNDGRYDDRRQDNRNDDRNYRSDRRGDDRRGGGGGREVDVDVREYSSPRQLS